MTDSHKREPNVDRLFIKVILPRQGTEKRVTGGGGKMEPFRVVDRAFRQSLSSRVQALSNAVSTTAPHIGAIPARVRLLPQALAKSHRPDTLFSDSTCPIVGAGRLGELFIRATPSGLQKLEQTIRDVQSDKIKKELSAVQTIEPITPDDRRRGYSSMDIIRNAPKSERGYVAKVQLFDLGLSDNRLFDDFSRNCAAAGIRLHRRGYTKQSQTFEVSCRSASDVDLLSRVIGVRAIRPMPVVASIRQRGEEQRGHLPANLPVPEGALNQYPVVAVVDTGIRNDIPALNAWVIGRRSTVAPNYRNPYHGTFVAGLVAFARDLNPQLSQIDANPCAIFDVHAVPNSDPAVGDVEHLLESVLLEDLEIVLKDHANEIKVWNLSLGTDETCSLDSFSSLAIELDRLQEAYGVSFVVSAGNYSDRPFLDYPRSPSQLESGRITTPGDSVLAITVGSVAHVDSVKTGPRVGEPSPFSRHGAGPNYIIKPDLVHFGGTFRPDGTQQRGIKSIVSSGHVGSDCGTSFATALVSRALAGIYHQITPTPSRELARAILTHHASDPRNGSRVPDQEENFLGFGLPAATPNCLECEPWMSTLVFEDTLRPGYFLEWDNFPYPPSLYRNGRFFGDISMTLAFAPARGAQWGTEYCGTHIDAHFGVYDNKTNRKTGEVSEYFKGLVPPEHKNPGVLYESYQVEKLRKWAPVRTYFGRLGPTGERGSRWRLKLQLLSRHGLDTPEMMRPQPFALVITIADPLRTAPVYDDMAVTIRSRFQANNLVLRGRSRVQTRSPR